MPEFEFTEMTDLAAEKLGGKTLLCSDDFFAETGGRFHRNCVDARLQIRKHISAFTVGRGGRGVAGILIFGSHRGSSHDPAIGIGYGSA